MKKTATDRLIEEGRITPVTIYYDGRALDRFYFFKGEDVDDFLDMLTNMISLLVYTHNTLKQSGCVLNPEMLKIK